MSQEQTATASFFLPVVLAWSAVLLGLELARRRCPAVWPAAEAPKSPRPRTDLCVALLTAGAVLGLGQAWHHGWLRWHWPGSWDHAAFALAQLLIWSPLPLALLLRQQPASTAWTGATRLGTRIAVGALLGCLAITVYLATRSELARWPGIVDTALTWRSLAHAVPVYFEGVGIAFVFVRLQWVLGKRLAALLPGLLFAAGHVPRALAEGDTWGTMAGFFVFNTLFITALLLVLTRYRDVVALGVAHWLMDIAIRAF